MAIEGSTTLKSYFEKGDQPTSAQFSSLIDSAILIPVSGASAKVGFVEIESSASATAHSLGTFNRGFLLDVANTAAARNFLAITSASGGGGGAVGQAILASNVTASVTNLLGVLPVATLPDASAAAQGIIEIASTAEASAGTDDTRALTPSNVIGHRGMAKVYAEFDTTGSSRQTHNVSAITDNAQGKWTVVFADRFSIDSYVAVAQIETDDANHAIFCNVATKGVSSAIVRTFNAAGSADETNVASINFVAFGAQL